MSFMSRQAGRGSDEPLLIGVLLGGVALFEIIQFIREKRKREIPVFLVLAAAVVTGVILFSSESGFSISGILIQALDLRH
jgi:hypothetical protein